MHSPWLCLVCSWGEAEKKTLCLCKQWENKQTLHTLESPVSLRKFLHSWFSFAAEYCVVCLWKMSKVALLQPSSTAEISQSWIAYCSPAGSPVSCHCSPPKNTRRIYKEKVLTAHFVLKEMVTKSCCCWGAELCVKCPTLRAKSLSFHVIL